MVCSFDDVTDLERSAARSWPALTAGEAGGWTCRTAAGYSQRANSCLPWESVTGNLGPRIDAVEAWYAAQHQPPVFKVPRLADWADLDKSLSRRDYRKATPSQILTKAVGATEVCEQFQASESFDEAWWAGYWGANNTPEAHRPVSRALAAKTNRAVVGQVTEAGADAAWAFLSIDGPRAWVFDVVVDPKRRRAGLGRRLMDGLEAEAARRGVKTLCLQVLDANEPAQRLYRHLGYTEAYGYHYRRKP
jgi:ribosomal protein S18 acetylase RimI-like enzyme